MIAPAAATETRMAPNDKRQLTPEVAGDLLEAIYAASCAALSRALDRYLATGTPPTLEERAAFRYPLLSVAFRCPPKQRAAKKGVNREKLKTAPDLVPHYAAKSTIVRGAQNISKPFSASRPPSRRRAGL